MLKEHDANQATGIAFEPFVRRKASLDFYDVSSLDAGKPMSDQDNIRANLDSYIQGFAPDVRSIFEHFDFGATVEWLHKAKLLYLVTEKFAAFPLPPTQVNNMQMPTLVVAVKRDGEHVPFDFKRNSSSQVAFGARSILKAKHRPATGRRTARNHCLRARADRKVGFVDVGSSPGH